VQFSEPRPGDPWPHDMVIRISDDGALSKLLFVREALGLPGGGVPPVSPVPHTGASARPPVFDVPAEAERWRSGWDAAWERLDRSPRTVPPTPEMQHLLDTTPDELLWEAVSGAVGVDRWDDSLDIAALQHWQGSLRGREGYRSLEETPERRSLDALVAAWRTGLTSVTTLPLSGFVARRVGITTLVVSYETREDPAMYRRALATPLER